ncbi:hypothetical protein SH501x_000137 [Pirellulaceae bacterium SH501]
MWFRSGGAGFELVAMITTFLHDGQYPESIRMYRVEEIRCKSDCKQLTHARRIVAAKLKRQKT